MLVSQAWRAAFVESRAAPGEVGRFRFTLRAPDAVGVHDQYFSLHHEGEGWFSDQGGPPDDQLQVRVEVVLRPGSVLYVPAGMWHRVECEDDSISLNISLIGAS